MEGLIPSMLLRGLEPRLPWYKEGCWHLGPSFVPTCTCVRVCVWTWSWQLPQKAISTLTVKPSVSGRYTLNTLHRVVVVARANPQHVYTLLPVKDPLTQHHTAQVTSDHCWPILSNADQSWQLLTKANHCWPLVPTGAYWWQVTRPMRPVFTPVELMTVHIIVLHLSTVPGVYWQGWRMSHSTEHLGWDNLSLNTWKAQQTAFWSLTDKKTTTGVLVTNISRYTYGNKRIDMASQVVIRSAPYLVLISVIWPTPPRPIEWNVLDSGTDQNQVHVHVQVSYGYGSSDMGDSIKFNAAPKNTR